MSGVIIGITLWVIGSAALGWMFYDLAAPDDRRAALVRWVVSAAALAFGLAVAVR